LRILPLSGKKYDHAKLRLRDKAEEVMKWVLDVTMAHTKVGFPSDVRVA